jgi:hypothetical protein
MLIITFVTTFVGMALLVALYSMLYGNEYYDLSAMFRYVLITNIVIFLFLAPVYLLFMGDVNTLFFVMALHLALVVYVCHMQLDMMVNPHYALSSTIGGTMGLVGGMLVYSLIIAAITSKSNSIQDTLHRYIILPPVLMYGAMPFAQGIRRMIYTRMYESGSDFLYLSSPSDLQAASNQDDDDEMIIVDDA